MRRYMLLFYEIIQVIMHSDEDNIEKLWISNDK